MAISQVQQLHIKIQGDCKFYLKFKNYVFNAADEKQRRQKIVAFGVENGFSFSIKELNQFLNKNGDGLNLATKIDAASEDLIGIGARKFFHWLGGVSPKVLATCPEAEQKRQTALAATILIPVLFSLVSSSYFLHTLKLNTILIFLGALMWATIVLIMDRALIASYRVDGSWWRKSIQVAIRLIIAILTSLTISHPILLIFFNGETAEEYKQVLSQQGTLAQNYRLRCLSNIDLDNKRENTVASKAVNLVASCAAYGNEPIRKTVEFAKEERKKNDAIANVKKHEGNIENIRSEFAKIDNDTTLTEAEKNRKKANQKNKEIRELLQKDKEEGSKRNADTEMKRLLNQDHINLNACQSREAVKINDIKITQEKIRIKNEGDKNWCQTKMADYNKLGKEPPDISQQTTALISILFKKDEVNYHGLIMAGTLFLLFLVIDTLPILLKIMRSGLYELRVVTDERSDKFVYGLMQRGKVLEIYHGMVSGQQSSIATMQNELIIQHLKENMEYFAKLFSIFDKAELDDILACESKSKNL